MCEDFTRYVREPREREQSLCPVAGRSRKRVCKTLHRKISRRKRTRDLRYSAPSERGRRGSRLWNYSTGGCLSFHGRASSNCAASEMIPASSFWRPTICSPIGRPALESAERAVQCGRHQASEEVAPRGNPG